MLLANTLESIRTSLISSLLATKMGVATPQIITQIQNPESPFTRNAALKALKNEIVGHDQKKEYWIKSGIIPALFPVLNGCNDANRTSNKLKAHARIPHDRSDIQTSEDEACLHAAIILGSIAQGTVRKI